MGPRTQSRNVHPQTGTEDQRNPTDSDKICYPQICSIAEIYPKGIVVVAVIIGEPSD